jgi:hypothetical protein
MREIKAQANWAWVYIYARLVTEYVIMWIIECTWYVSRPNVLVSKQCR